MPPVVKNAIRRGGTGDVKKIEAAIKRLLTGGLYADLAKKLNVAEATLGYLRNPEIAEHARYPGVHTAFMSFEFWMAVYDPQRAAPLEDSHATYLRMQVDHRESVMEQVNRLGRTLSGRALLAEIAASRHWVRIYPFFRWDRYKDGDDLAGGGPRGKPGESAAVQVLQYCYGEPPPMPGNRDALGKRRRAPAVCPVHPRWGRRGGWSHGVGRDMTLVYTPQMWGPGGWRGETDPPFFPDAVLFHELAHSTRFMRGTSTFFPVTGGGAGGYGNEEEYFAIVLEWIYISEKGQTYFRSGHWDGAPSLGSGEVGRFVRENPQGLDPSPSSLMARFRRGQRSFFDALASIRPEVARVNVVRDYANW
jgi:hypothetical protein